MEVWEFSAKNLPVLSGFEIRRLWESWDNVSEINVTLGKSGNIRAERKGSELLFTFGGREYALSAEEVRELAGKPLRRIYAVADDGIVRLHAFRDGKYYQLVAVGPSEAPTIEINGIHMHRVAGITPYRDAMSKVKALGVRRGMRVLDVCTGLGYTAIWEAKFGARVTTIEIDENVLALAEYNPWSWELAEVEIIRGDATSVVEGLRSNSYDAILVDPPRFSLAPELYSEDFFRDLFKILKPRGKLFLYTGKPGERSGKRFVKGVLERLRRAGFSSPRFNPKVMGVLAFKRRAL